MMSANFDSAMQTMEDAIAASKQFMDGFVTSAQNAATQNFEQALANGKAQYEKLSAQYDKAHDEMVALSRGCGDAAMAGGAVFAKGMDDLGKVWLTFVRASADKGVETAKAVAAAKTMQEVVDLQSGYARNAIDEFVAESTKISEMSLKVANEAFAPLNAKVNEVVEILSRPLAA